MLQITYIQNPSKFQFYFYFNSPNISQYVIRQRDIVRVVFPNPYSTTTYKIYGGPSSSIYQENHVSLPLQLNSKDRTGVYSLPHDFSWPKWSRCILVRPSNGTAYGLPFPLLPRGICIRHLPPVLVIYYLPLCTMKKFWQTTLTFISFLVHSL